MTHYKTHAKSGKIVTVTSPLSLEDLLALPLHGRIARVLDESGKTQDAFAYELGTTRETLNRWVNGRSTPDRRSARQIARVTGYPVDVFLERTVTVGTSELESIRAELAALRGEIRPKGSPSPRQIGLELASQLEEQTRILRLVVDAVEELRGLVADLREQTERAPRRRTNTR